MRGIYTDPEANPAASQPPYVLAAWIQEQLGDIHKTQIRRLQQLRARLQTEAFEWDDAMLAQATTALHSAGRELHFLPLRQGFIGRLLGRHRAANARFIAAYDRVVACASQLKAELAQLSA